MDPQKTKPILPLRDIVIFPSMVVPLFVGREKSIIALQEVMKTDKSILLVAQKNSEIDEPESKDIYGFGCLSKVLQLLKLPDGTVKILVEGLQRVKILEVKNSSQNFLTCEIQAVTDTNKTKESNVYSKNLVKKFEKLTNIGAVLNTSFNLSGFPNVSTPHDAIDTVLKSGLEYLVLGNFVLKKIKN